MVLSAVIVIKALRTEGIICVSGGSLVVENGTIIRDNQMQMKAQLMFLQVM